MSSIFYPLFSTCVIYSFRLAENVVFAALNVCIKESCNTVLQCGSLDDEAFDTLVSKHPVSRQLQNSSFQHCKYYTLLLWLSTTQSPKVNINRKNKALFSLYLCTVYMTLTCLQQSCNVAVGSFSCNLKFTKKF